MVRAVSLLLPLSLAATAVNAQFGDFFKNAFGGALQQPLGSAIPSRTPVLKNTYEITSENWRNNIDVAVDPAAGEDAAKEWYFYFTTSAANSTGDKNVTYWDGVYNVCVLAGGSWNRMELI